MFWAFTVWKNCSSHLKNFAKSQLSVSSFKKFSQSLEHFFLTANQNNFGNKIPVDSADISWIQNQNFLRVIRILCIIAAAVEYRLRLLHTVHPFNLQRTLCVFLTLWTKLIKFVQKLWKVPNFLKIISRDINWTSNFKSGKIWLMFFFLCPKLFQKREHYSREDII